MTLAKVNYKYSVDFLFFFKATNATTVSYCSLSLNKSKYKKTQLFTWGKTNSNKFLLFSFPILLWNNKLSLWHDLLSVGWLFLLLPYNCIPIARYV